MLKNKINKMKKFGIALLIVILVFLGIVYFAHYHVSLYCLRQKQLTDSIAKSDSASFVDSINGASHILDSIEKNDSTDLKLK